MNVLGSNGYDDTDIELYKCVDESCLSGLTSVDLKYLGNGTETILREYPNSLLSTSTWYLAKVVSSTLYGLGSITTLIPPPPTGLLGKQATPTQWKFKTKDSPEPCVVDSVKMYPDPFTAYFIGQKKQYNAQPKGAPDSCSPYGQFLNPWDYGWQWGVVDSYIATTTNFALSKNKNNFCTTNCLPKGSDVASSTVAQMGGSYSICGNGTVDPGEDCDIASTTPDGIPETPGVSCTYSCVRPGNTDTTITVLMSGVSPQNQNKCGDGFVDYLKGEECDSNDPKLKSESLDGKVVDYSPYCSATTCLWTGSDKTETGDLAKPICGSGGVTPGEDCDGTKGFSASCLNVGTNLEQAWCDSSTSATYAPTSTAYCKNALSVCGNNKVESGEECEVGISGATTSTCSDKCLVQNACETGLSQCTKGIEGCNDDCTLKGSSILYPTPSICGDGLSGIGEYTTGKSCEVASADFGLDLGGNPVQIVTAVGDQNSNPPATTPLDFLSTKIESTPINYINPDGGVSSTDKNITGSADYNLMCGFTEYASSTSPYNDCPNNDANNIYGVGTNSCCTERPVRTDQYPAVNAGIGSEGVCRNTFIAVEFDKTMNA
ncbi:MAG: hypothetical protein HYV41_01255, partial [Candidatus Magasanikbacteria bacterium]|nr:hypothetical protein [Candidatus Magasanikbacteria bacterium]